MAKVDVKLSHQCLVNGAIREAGEIVEMDPKLAPAFGEVQQIEMPPPPKPAKKKEKNGEKTETVVRNK